MSAPQQPWPAFQPHPQGPAYPPMPPARRHSTFDNLATVVMFLLAFAAGAVSLFWSLFFGMATDACSTHCNDALIGWAYLITWGGTAAAAIVAFTGATLASKRGRPMWIWPTLALAMIIAATAIGAFTAGSVIPHS
jgi:hypothetical protein